MPLQYAYPLRFTFKTFALAPQFTVEDADGLPVAYIRQKLFKFKEEVKVYRSEAQDDLLYTINADRWLDWSASYAFAAADGKSPLGRVARQGMRSLWKAHYDVINAAGEPAFTVREDSVVTRILDNLLGEIPLLGLFTGYLFNPTYVVNRVDGVNVGHFRKLPSAIGRKFELDLQDHVTPTEEVDLVLSLMMLVLLERGRG